MSFPETRRFRPIPAAALLMLVCLCMAGCSRQPFQTAEVTGRITAGGNPVPGILVMFAPPGGSSKGLPTAYGVSDATGQYRAIRPRGKPGAVVGPVDVALSLADGYPDRPPGISATRLANRRHSFYVKPGGNAFDISLDD